MGQAKQETCFPCRASQSEQLWKVPGRQDSSVGRKATRACLNTLVSKTPPNLGQLSSGKPSQLASSSQIRAAFLAHPSQLYTEEGSEGDKHGAEGPLQKYVR